MERRSNKQRLEIRDQVIDAIRHSRERFEKGLTINNLRLVQRVASVTVSDNNTRHNVGFTSAHQMNL